MPEYPGENFFSKYFLKQRKLFLWGDINLQRSYFIVNSLKFLASKNLDPIYIYINSDGGEVDNAISIIDEIERIKQIGITVYTIVIGAAFSSAAFILLAGSEGCRIATPNSTILIHMISYGIDFESATKNKRYSDFTEKQNETLVNIVAQYCKKNTVAKLKKFKDEIKDDLWLSAKDAIKFGVIDTIGDI